LLQILAQHAGNVVTHQQLLTEVWGANTCRRDPISVSESLCASSDSSSNRIRLSRASSWPSSGSATGSLQLADSLMIRRGLRGIYTLGSKYYSVFMLFRPFAQAWVGWTSCGKRTPCDICRGVCSARCRTGCFGRAIIRPHSAARWRSPDQRQL